MVKPISQTRQSTQSSGASKSTKTRPEAAKPASQANQSASPREQVALSPKAKMAHDVTAAAHQSSGVDSARVRVIREAIQSGNYKVSPTEIAKAVAEAAWMTQGK